MQVLYTWLGQVAPHYLSNVNWLRPRDFMPERVQLLGKETINQNWCICPTQATNPKIHLDECFTFQAAMGQVCEHFPEFVHKTPSSKLVTPWEALQLWMTSVLDWLDDNPFSHEVITPLWRKNPMGRNMVATMGCTTRKAQLCPSGVYKVMVDVYVVERPRGCTMRSHLIDPNM